MTKPSKKPGRNGRIDPLPSWNDTPVKRAILDLVTRVTRKGSRDFVPPAERIAVFDHDGTLWTERPLFAQVFFALDRLEQLAEHRRELREDQPFKAFLERDQKTVATFSKREIFEFAIATHAGLTTEEFDRMVKAWLAVAHHPQLGRPFPECAYQPQLELLEFLRAKGFKTFIVTGGGVGFVRGFGEQVYGIPPEQIIGSSNKTRVEFHDHKPGLFKLGELGSFNDRNEKVVNIDLHIGRRPILAFGNSDGDLRMLQYVMTGPRAGLALLLHHDDGAREFAYDRDFRFSPLAEALDRADELGLTVVSMKRDWQTVFVAPRRESAMKKRLQRRAAPVKPIKANGKRR